MKKLITNAIEERGWEEFRETGLFMFINTVLHAFGWAIVCKINANGNILNVYPARVKFRGFDNEDQSEMHTRIANYLKDNAPNFPEEIK